MSPGRHGRRSRRVVVDDGPAVAQRSGDRADDIDRFTTTEFVGGSEIAGPRAADEVGVVVGAEHRDRPVVEQVRRPARIEALEGGLRVGLVLDDLAEDVVGELDDGCRGAEVGAQSSGVGADLLGGTQVLADVGATESVDRLFRIAHDEQPPGEGSEVAPVGVLMWIVRWRGETNGDLQLNGVGVLELVEQHPLVPPVQCAADLDVVGLGEQAARVDEEVVEVEDAGVDTAAHGIEDEAPGDRPGKPLAICLGLLDDGVDGVDERLLP